MEKKKWVLLSCLMWWWGAVPGPVAAGEPLTLKEALVLAREKSPAMIEMRKKVAEAEGERKQAGAFENPEMEGEIGLGSGNESKVLEVRQRFAFPGTRHMGGKAAKHALTGRRERLRAVWAVTYREARIAFERLILDEKVLILAREKLEIIRQWYSRVQLDYHSGKKLKNDMLRASVELSKAEGELVAAERDLRMHAAALNLLLGRFPDTKLDVSGDLKKHAVDMTWREMWETASKRRGDIRAEDAELAAARAALGKERLSRLPSFSIGYQSAEERGVRDNALLVGMEVPVWDLNTGGVRAARARRDQQVSRTEGMRNQAAFEVYEAYLDLKLARRRFDMSGKLLDQGNELIRLAGLRYREGDIGLLSFLDQINTGAQARVDHFRSLFELNAAITRMESVIHDSLRGEDYLQ